MLSKNMLAALMLAPLLSTSLPAIAAPRYTVVALPELATAAGINNSGQIVGDIATATGRDGFIWSNGVLEQFGAPGAPFTVGSAINNAGVAVGHAGTADGQIRALSYNAGSITTFSVFGASGSFATAVNDAGEIAGDYSSEATGGGAFHYANGVATDLGHLGGGFAAANAINSAGHIVGFSALDDAPFHAHGFLYADGVMHDLGAFPDASLSEATAINDSDQITGHGWVQGSFHAFLYERGELKDLGTLGGRESYAYDINASGQIVGYSDLEGQFQTAAYLWEGGAMFDLNSLIDPADGWTLYQASGINDRGQITAIGCRSDECASVLLDIAAAVPEPGTFVLLVVGLGLLGWRRVR